MLFIPIVNIPNQSFALNLDSNFYDIRIHSCRSNDVPGTGIMAVDISINNILTVSGTRAVAGFPIIPYAYLQNGNFVFMTANDDLPNWRQFGITQSLIYASQAELEALQGAA